MRTDGNDVLDYYHDPTVRDRIHEYSHGAVSMAAFGGTEQMTSVEGGPRVLDTPGLDRAFGSGADICRSLADTDGTLLHLDIEYVDPVSPDRPAKEPERVFRQLEPFYRAARDAFSSFGVVPLVLVTGRGYHMVVRVGVDSPFHHDLVQIGTLDAPLQGKYLALHDPPRAVSMGHAHAGAGRLLELLAHQLIRESRRKLSIPILLADVPSPVGGESIYLDLSAYGDPLFERHVRTAFSLHHERFGQSNGVQVVIPRGDLPLDDVLAIRDNLAAANGWSRRVSTSIPELPHRATAWIDQYLKSPLAAFHSAFDRGEQVAWRDWPLVYDGLDIESLPPCVAEPLLTPNPLLLKPVHLRTVALFLGELGFAPRWIAGLIRSKYERDFGWGSTWYRYDAAARADFYVRLFSAARALGLDRPDPLDCRILSVSGACPVCCDYDLSRLRSRKSGIKERRGGVNTSVLAPVS